jgi:hypothetical protein
LEDILQQISYALQPFSEFDQVKFLEKFWTENLYLRVTNKKVNLYAQTLIRKLAQSISDKDRAFTGIPLQTHVIAEAFEEEFRLFYVSEKSEPELPQKLDLLGLYRSFVDKKYDMYYEVRSTSTAGKMAAEDERERDRKFVKEQHQLLALEYLTEDLLTALQIDDKSELKDETLAGIGIAHRSKDGKPHFIHRTFAEFHVAEFLIKQLQKKTERHKKVQNFLLNEVLLKPDYRVIRTFLDGLLGQSAPSAEVLKDYGKKLDEQWNTREAHRPPTSVNTALFQTASEDNVNIIGFIVDSLKSAGCFNTLKEIVLAKNNQGRNALYMAGENGSLQELKRIWEWVKEMVTAPGSSLPLAQNQHQ